MATRVSQKRRGRFDATSLGEVTLLADPGTGGGDCGARASYRFSAMPNTSPRRLAIAALVLLGAATRNLAGPTDARADDVPGTGASDETVQGADGDSQVGVGEDAYADTDPSALTDFQSTLDPHGTWVDDPTYGTVWTPNVDEVGADFAPYLSAGHWSYDDGDVWVSDYTWGWAAFHYGRWVWLEDRGWSWIPGRLYADAWVVWRLGEDGSGYVGWAPMAPTWGWRGGVAGLLGFVPFEPFVFCPSRQLFTPDLGPQIVRGEPAAPLMAQTRPYVRASPVVGPPAGPGRGPQGPAPASLGIETSRVPRRPAATDVALVRARQFARPSTALALGGRPPVVHVIRPKLVARPNRVERPAVRPQRRK